MKSKTKSLQLKFPSRMTLPKPKNFMRSKRRSSKKKGSSSVSSFTSTSESEDLDSLADSISFISMIDSQADLDEREDSSVKMDESEEFEEICNKVLDEKRDPAEEFEASVPTSIDLRKEECIVEDDHSPPGIEEKDMEESTHTLQKEAEYVADYEAPIPPSKGESEKEQTNPSPSLPVAKHWPVVAVAAAIAAMVILKISSPKGKYFK